MSLRPKTIIKDRNPKNWGKLETEEGFGFGVGGVIFLLNKVGSASSGGADLACQGDLWPLGRERQEEEPKIRHWFC